jgi:hypothetical protein
MSDYFKEFNAAVTVCDVEGNVIWMNDKSKLVNHGDFTGKSLLACHPEPAKTKLLDLMKNQNTNVYTIEKGNIKKMIFQSPWYENGIYAGIVEISMEIPFETPHYILKRKKLQKMNIKLKLSQRIGIKDIKEINIFLQNKEERIEELYSLLYDPNDIVAYQAAWVMCHFSKNEKQWLYEKQNEMIDEALICTHPGKRRLILTLLLKQPFEPPPRLDFLDFCLERMYSNIELPGVQTNCIKLAYKLTKSIPELLNQYIHTLKLIDLDLLPPSLQCCITNIFKQIYKNEAFQSKTFL